MSLESFTTVNRLVAILDTSTTSSTSQFTTVSIAVLLVLAWTVIAMLIIAGISTKRNRVYSLGIMATGTMTILTPLVYYISETLRLGAFTASIQDFLLVTGLSTLGGGVITIGLLKLTHHSLTNPSQPS